MNPEKAARANSTYKKIQLAHIRSLIGTHHSPSSEQMLESYQQAFETYIARPDRSLDPERPDRQVPENVLRLPSAEPVVIGEILTKCYNADKQIMLENLGQQADLLDEMPAILDYPPLKPKD